MAAIPFRTGNSTFRQLIGNGMSYRIPRFQQDYSWGEDEWEDLWTDILATLHDGPDSHPEDIHAPEGIHSPESAALQASTGRRTGGRRPAGDSASHYMGYLVLQSADDRVFDVIDGQQRLTTLSIIVLAALKHLQRLVEKGEAPENNTRRLEQIRQTYVGYLDPVTLVTRPKLTLNRNNNSYYQNHLVPLGHLPQRGFRASEHLLRRAFEWFDRRIGEYLRTQPSHPSAPESSTTTGSVAHTISLSDTKPDSRPGPGTETVSAPDARQHHGHLATTDASPGDTSGARIAQLVEDLSDRLFFTVITVSDELNAYTVFETLNARGVRLSATDLLKNYLFSLLDHGADSQHELATLEERWEQMVGRLQSEKFPDFLRAHWNSRHRFARQSELFKHILARVRDRAGVFALIRDMEEDLDCYLALSSPETSGWSPEDRQLAATLKTFRVRQPYPLLLAARRTLGDSDFTALLRATVVISLRYNVIGAYGTAEQERTYNQVAERMARGELAQLPPILQAMRSIYVEDRVFRAAFADKTIRTTDTRNNRVVRFILCALERHLAGQALDFGSDAFNVEHVLPQNVPDGWGGFTPDEAQAMAYRLGNMTLLQSGANRDAGNSSYAAKRAIYQQSGCALTRRLAADNADWTPERITAWQNWMADQASSIWRIAQLS